MAIQFLRGSGVSYSTLNSLAIGQPYYDYTNNRLYIGDGNTARTSNDECDPVNQNYWNQLFYCYRSGADSTGYAYEFSCQFKTKTVGTTATLVGISTTMYNAGYSSLAAFANGSCLAVAASTSTTSTVYTIHADTNSANASSSFNIGRDVLYIKATSQAYFTLYYSGVQTYYTSVNGTMTYYPHATAVSSLSTGTYAPTAVTLLSAERNC